MQIFCIMMSPHEASCKDWDAGWGKGRILLPMKTLANAM